jgi:hypothetical protein
MFDVLLGGALVMVGGAGAAGCWLWAELNALGDELGEAAARGFAEGAAEVMGVPRSLSGQAFETSTERAAVVLRLSRARALRSRGLARSRDSLA